VQQEALYRFSVQANRGLHPIVCVLFAHSSLEALEQEMIMLDLNAARGASCTGVLCDLIQGSLAVIECGAVAATLAFKPASPAAELS
jgi:hypothetical protein